MAHQSGWVRSCLPTPEPRWGAKCPPPPHPVRHACCSTASSEACGLPWVPCHASINERQLLHPWPRQLRNHPLPTTTTHIRPMLAALQDNKQLSLQLDTSKVGQAWARQGPKPQGCANELPGLPSSSLKTHAWTRRLHAMMTPPEMNCTDLGQPRPAAGCGGQGPCPTATAHAAVCSNCNRLCHSSLLLA